MQNSTPPESVSRSVLEVEPPEFVLNQDIAGPKEGVALLEDVGQDLLLGRLWIAVALSEEKEWAIDSIAKSFAAVLET